MAGTERFEDLIGKWLEEDAAHARIPQRVLMVTFERTRRSGQRRAWREILGRLQMPRFAPVLGAVAAVVVAAVAALNLFPVLGPGGPPSPTPTPTVAPSPAASATVDKWLEDCVEFRTTTTYRAPVGTFQLTATVPSGWSGGKSGFGLQNMFCLFGASVYIEVDLVQMVFADACDPFSAIRTETTAAAVAALTTQAGHDTAGPIETTLAGLPASRFEMSNAVGCEKWYMWRSPASGPGPDWGISPGERQTIYLVDVDGATLAAATNADGDGPPEALAARDAILASLVIEP